MSHCAAAERTPARRSVEGIFAVVALLAMNLARAAGAAEAHGPNWIGTWAAAPQPFMPGSLEHYANQTLRLVAHVSAGGDRVRIRLSNAFGDRTLVVGSARIARRTQGPGIDPASDRVLHFRGRTDIAIPAHATVVSDAVDLDVAPLSDLAVSLFLPRAAAATTTHFLALQTNYVSAATGDATAAAEFPVERTTASWPFLAGIDVAVNAHGAAVVAFGDSTVDGDGSGLDANHRWPDLLAARLQRQNPGRPTGVLNAGIIGNRLLSGSPADSEFGAALGEAALVRFRRDALDQPGVGLVIVRTGSNDIGFAHALTPATPGVTAERLISGYERLAADAHRKGIRIVATTIPPFENASVVSGYYTADKEIVRQQVNAWMRKGKGFDAVVDFDAVLRDPDHPARLRPAFDSGDHLHPDDAGYAALADAIPLSLFSS